MTYTNEDYGQYLMSRMRRVDEAVLPIEDDDFDGCDSCLAMYGVDREIDEDGTIYTPPSITPQERLAGVKVRLIERAQALHDNAALAIMGQPLTLNF